MSRLPSVLPVLLFALLATASQADAKLEAYVKEARAKLADQRAAGLKSLVAKMTITSHENEDLEGDKYASVGFQWTAPETQKLDVSKLPEGWRGSVGKALDGVWRMLTGAHIYDELAALEELELTRTRKGATIVGAHPKAGPVTVTFDRSKRLTELRFTRHGMKYTYHYAKQGKQRWRVDVREEWRKDKRHLVTRFGAVRKVGKYQLPTSLVLMGADGEKVDVTIEYTTVDGGKVAAPETDKDLLKKTIAAFERGWKRWSAKEKAHQMAALSDQDADAASAAIARRGLTDGDPEVRKAAADLLAKMKRKNVTTQVVAALRPNAGHPAVYRSLCLAIAAIGDHRAVEPLSKNWWRDTKAGEDGLRGRIYAIGKIRHVSSIDALMGILYVTDGDAVGKYKDVILTSLRGLTGQDFGEDRRAWRNWWKKAKPTFRFPKQ